MRRFLTAVATVAGLAAAPQAGAENLTDALIAAYRNSNLLAQNQAVLRAADEDVAGAVSALRPVIAYTMSGSYSHADFAQSNSLGATVRGNSESWSSSVGLTASILLYDGGRSRMAIEAAKEAVLGTRQALINVEQQVLLSAVSAYVDVRLQREIVALRESNVRLITQELGAARDRFEVGEVTRTDVAQAEARLATARANLASAQGALTMAREAYNAAVGHYPNNLAPLPRSPVTARTVDEARSVALRSHPSILQLQHQVKAADISVAIAKAAMQPTLSGGASLTHNFNGLDNRGVSLTMNQTLYGGGELSSLYRRSIASKESVRAQLHQSGVTVGEAVGNAWVSIEVAVSAIDAGAEGVAAAQTAFDGVREEARLGARTTLDVLDAELELLTARASRLEAEASRYVGNYQLLSTMGLLTVKHLNLGIPTYDPESYYNAVKNAPASLQGKKLDRVMEKLGKN